MYLDGYELSRLRYLDFETLSNTYFFMQSIVLNIRFFPLKHTPRVDVTVSFIIECNFSLLVLLDIKSRPATCHELMHVLFFLTKIPIDLFYTMETCHEAKYMSYLLNQGISPFESFA